MNRPLLAFCLVLAFAGPAYNQKLKKADKLILQNLENHVHFLADDKLEGRRAGSPGEKLASDYIIAQFHQAGVEEAFQRIRSHGLAAVVPRRE